MNTSDLAQVYVTDAGLIDQTKIDYHKTEVRLLLKKSFGGGRYGQAFYMTLHQSDGKSISIITDSTTESDGECPGTDGVKIFVVSRELGNGRRTTGRFRHGRSARGASAWRWRHVA